MEKAIDRKIITVEEWEKKGKELFGEKKRDWKFICPMCKTPQSFNDLLEAGVSENDAKGFAGFSCIGRFNEKRKGCDWTLGGFFQIHTLEITDGKNTDKSFEFYEKDKKQ